MAQVSLVTSARSAYYIRLSPAHDWLCEANKPEGLVYLVDQEKKEITFPGHTEPTKMYDVLARDYPPQYVGYVSLEWVTFRGIGQHAVAFMRRV